MLEAEFARVDLVAVPPSTRRPEGIHEDLTILRRYHPHTLGSETLSDRLQRRNEGERQRPRPSAQATSGRILEPPQDAARERRGNLVRCLDKGIQLVPRHGGQRGCAGGRHP
jgi:hypothetical protein